MSEHPFHQWVAAAEPKREVWRTLAGFVLILIIWTGWTAVLGLIAVGGGLVNPRLLAGSVQGNLGMLSFAEAAVLLGVMLATFWGLWLGAWIVLKALHRRGLSTLVSSDGRLRLGQFGVGAALAAAYLAAGLVYALAMGAAPIRTDIDPGQWLVAFIPLALLVLAQSAGEEVVFRGYLPQQLAARWRHPLVWGLLPSLAFGLAHVFNGGALDSFALYYVAAATTLGLVMMAMVWRTGSLAAAMGFHFVNNIGALLIVGVVGVGPPVSLWMWLPGDAVAGASTDLLMLGLLLAFMLSPLMPLPKGQPLRRNETRAAP
ncbi:MAG: type II CAAX endopeptidase family protein [Hyphomonadaceae bacterium]